MIRIDIRAGLFCLALSLGFRIFPTTYIDIYTYFKAY